MPQYNLTSESRLDKTIPRGNMNSGLDNRIPLALHNRKSNNAGRGCRKVLLKAAGTEKFRTKFRNIFLNCFF